MKNDLFQNLIKEKYITKMTTIDKSYCESNNRIVKVDVDTDNNLDMFSFETCLNDDTPLFKYTHGVIFKDDKLVVKGLPFIETISHTDKKNLNEKLFNNKISDDWYFYGALEGTVLRLYYLNNKWNMSTYKKLDAFSSRWSADESFGKQFITALDDLYSQDEKFRNYITSIDSNQETTLYELFINSLNKSHQYNFILTNNHLNRIVIKYHPTIRLIGQYDIGKNLADVTTGFEPHTADIGIQYLDEFSINNLDDLVTTVNNIPSHLQGILCINKHTNEFVKVVHYSYLRLYNIRGNIPNILSRYVQVRTNGLHRDEMYDLYKDYVSIFDMFELKVWNVSNEIYQEYIKKFIGKDKELVDKNHYWILKLCHSFHCENRKQNKVNLNKVLEIVNDLQPQFLLSLINGI
jgi:hypothetical protein